MTENPFIEPEKVRAALAIDVKGYYPDGKSHRMDFVIDNAFQNASIPIAHRLLRAQRDDKPVPFPEYFNASLFERSTTLQSLTSADIECLIELHYNSLLSALLSAKSTPLIQEDVRQLYSLVYHLLNPELEHQQIVRRAMETAFETMELGLPLSEEETLRCIPEILAKAKKIKRER